MSKENQKPNEQGKRSRPTGGEPGRRERSNFDKATDVVIDLGKVGSGVKAAYDIYKIVRPLINDPSWYDNGKVPGSTGKLNPMLPNEWKRYHSATSLQMNSGVAPTAGNQIGVLDILITRGGSNGKSDVVRAMYTMMEHKARYTMPFTRDDLANYIEDCKMAMILYSKAVCWMQMANTFAAGNSPLAYEQYVATTEWGDTYASIANAISYDRIAVENTLVSFGNFINDNVVYDAPIMQKILYAGTTLFADSPKFGASVMKINYSGYTSDWAAKGINMINSTDRHPISWKASHIIGWMDKFKLNWSQTNSTIAGKLLETSLGKRFDLKFRDHASRRFPIVYDPEINTQLRNALMVAGFSYSVNDSASSSSLTPDSTFPQKNVPFVSSAFDPSDKMATGGVMNVVLDDNGSPVNAAYISLYTRLGRNHMQMFRAQGSDGEDYLKSVGVVELDDFELDSSAKVASALEMVPRIGVSWSNVANNFGVMASMAYGVEVPWRISMAHIDDRVVGNELVAFAHLDENLYVADPGYVGFANLKTHMASNWGNSPIYDAIHFMLGTGQFPKYVDPNTDFNTIADATVMNVDTRYNRIFEVSDSILAGIKYVQDYSLHSTEEFTKAQ